MSNNEQFLKELEVIINSVEFGKITPELEIHQKKVVSAKFQGWRRQKFNRDNEKAVEAVGSRIAEAIGRKDPSKIVFVVEVKNGVIEQILWQSSIYRRYD